MKYEEGNKWDEEENNLLIDLIICPLPHENKIYMQNFLARKYISSEVESM